MRRAGILALLAACGSDAPGEKLEGSWHEVGLALQGVGDHAGAFAIFDAMCSLDPRSCLSAWLMIRRGLGPAAHDAPHAYLTRGCGDDERRMPTACAILGAELVEGRATIAGAPDDVRRGEQLLRRACLVGEPLGCYVLGVRHGDDPRLAYHYFELACGDTPPADCLECAQACHAQGTMLLNGRGTAKDVTRGSELIARACAAHHEVCPQRQ